MILHVNRRTVYKRYSLQHREDVLAMGRNDEFCVLSGVTARYNEGLL